jgi:O-antigen ligase
MRIRLSLPKLGLLLALLLIGYKNITSLLWQYSFSDSTLISLVMLIVAVIALYVVVRSPIPKKSVTLTLLLYYICILLSCILNGYANIFAKEPTLLFAIAYWIFIFFLFQEIGKNRMLTAERFTNYFFLLTVVCFVLLFRYYFTNLLQTVQLTGLNVVYYLTFMFPIVLMSDNKKIVSVGIAMNLLAALISGKRGALLAMVVSLAIWMYTDLRDQRKRKKMFKVLLYIVIAVAAFFAVEIVVEKLNLDILRRVEALVNGEDSGGNGRTKIWSIYWDYLKNDSLVNNIFGRGYTATKRNPSLIGLGMGWAHNDFLQVFFDYGIIGLLLFCSIVYKLFANYFSMRKSGYRFHRQFLISLVIFLFGCSMSMTTIQPQWFLAMAALWGFVVGDYERELKECNR